MGTLLLLKSTLPRWSERDVGSVTLLTGDSAWWLGGWGFVAWWLGVVLRGRDLAACDSNGLSDPYVKLTYQKVKAKTQIIRKTLNPVWNEAFPLYVRASERATLCASVYRVASDLERTLNRLVQRSGASRSRDHSRVLGLGQALERRCAADTTPRHGMDERDGVPPS